MPRGGFWESLLAANFNSRLSWRDSNRETIIRPEFRKEMRPASNSRCKFAVSNSPLRGSRRSELVELAQLLICEASSSTLVARPVTAQRFRQILRTSAPYVPWPILASMRACLVVLAILRLALTDSTSRIN